jgi:hypothetical protein
MILIVRCVDKKCSSSEKVHALKYDFNKVEEELRSMKWGKSADISFVDKTITAWCPACSRKRNSDENGVLRKYFRTHTTVNLEELPAKIWCPFCGVSEDMERPGIIRCSGCDRWIRLQLKWNGDKD